MEHPPSPPLDHVEAIEECLDCLISGRAETESTAHLLLRASAEVRAMCPLGGPHAIQDHLDRVTVPTLFEKFFEKYGSHDDEAQARIFSYVPRIFYVLGPEHVAARGKYILEKLAQARARARLDTYREELMAAAWHPRRFMDWGLDAEERADLMET